MLDIKFIRENVAIVKKGLKAKGVEFDFTELLALDKQWRDELTKIDELRSKQNAANDEISSLIKDKRDPKEKIAQMKAISSEISKLEPGLKEFSEKIQNILLCIPNLPHGSVPVGGVENNKEVK